VSSQADAVEVSGPSTHVYQPTWNGRTRAFRAWLVPGAIVADIRLFGRDGTPDQNRLIFRPEFLLADGVPADVVESARHSSPQGFAVIPDRR
jgi:hypothetical protein